jgi:methionyl-tRNA formyltransferase
MRVVFMGTPAAAVPCLKRLVDDGHEVVAVYCQPDRPSGRGQKLTPPPVKVVAEELGIPVRQPHKVRTPKAADEFRSLGADVAVVVAYGRILPKEFLEAFRYGCINIHFSLLPKYRGAAPVNWAIVNRESETGVCSMKMDEGLDTGDLLIVEKTALDPLENSVQLMERLAGLGADVLSKTLSRIDGLVPIRQNDAAASLAPILKKSDGLIDWTLDAATIAARVRGFQPFPSSFSFFSGKKVTIWNAQPASESFEGVSPGEIVSVDGGALLIACGGRQAISVSEIQIEGKKRMPARDFLNGQILKVGDILGNQ